MERREQDILNKVEEKTKDVQVPESLKPGQIEKLLQEKDNKYKPNRAGVYRIGGLLAACLVLAAGIGTCAVDSYGKRAKGRDSSLRSE